MESGLLYCMSFGNQVTVSTTVLSVLNSVTNKQAVRTTLTRSRVQPRSGGQPAGPMNPLFFTVGHGFQRTQ